MSIFTSSSLSLPSTLDNEEQHPTVSRRLNCEHQRSETGSSSSHVAQQVK
jgi:hypothetical protein